MFPKPPFTPSECQVTPWGVGTGVPHIQTIGKLGFSSGAWTVRV